MCNRQAHPGQWSEEHENLKSSQRIDQDLHQTKILLSHYCNRCRHHCSARNTVPAPTPSTPSCRCRRRSHQCADKNSRNAALSSSTAHRSSSHLKSFLIKVSIGSAAGDLTVVLDNGENGFPPQLRHVNEHDKRYAQRIQVHVESLVDLGRDSIGQNFRYRQCNAHDNEHFRVECR